MSDKSIPDPDKVKEVFRDTYKFYEKWKDISSADDWVQLMFDMRELDAKYDCGLCRGILLELVKVIENEFKERTSDETG